MKTSNIVELEQKKNNIINNIAEYTENDTHKTNEKISFFKSHLFSRAVKGKIFTNVLLHYMINYCNIIN